MPQAQILFLLFPFVLFICVISSKAVYKLGIPVLLIFLSAGMLLGSDGLGGIQFTNVIFTQNLSILALTIILFSGGFDTRWEKAKPILAPASLLATGGVFITAGLTGLFAYYVMGLSLKEGLLLGAVVSSTDAASVFSILRSMNLNLKGCLAPLLEVESGSNDPMSYLLTILVMALIAEQSIGSLIGNFFIQLAGGALAGYLFGRIWTQLLNRITLDIEGLYPILTISTVLITYTASDILGCNGLLAVYIMGLVLGNTPLVHKRDLVRFFDGLSWLMQVFLFFTLGLLVFPSRMPEVASSALLTTLFLIFIARPVAVFICMSFFKANVKEKLFISWVGFRGAASIVFATFPLAAGIPAAFHIFHTVFFLTIMSVLLQGILMPFIARKLDLIDPHGSILEFFNDYASDLHKLSQEVTVPFNSPAVGRSIISMNIPREILIVMIKRGNELLTPKGSTEIAAGDRALVLADKSEQIVDLQKQWKLT